MTRANDEERCRELGDFLRSRRMRLTPESLGLPKRPRRRGSGLRREEVAELAGISVTWYTWLEQGRALNVSPKTVESIAKALRLDESERSHLLRLAHPDTLEHEVHDIPRKILQTILDQLNPNPSYIIDKQWNFVGWNRAATLVFKIGDPDEAFNSNLLEYVFRSNYIRNLLSSWHNDVEEFVAQFRADYDPEHHQQYHELVASLQQNSAVFSSLWDKHDVARRAGWTKELDHPVVGRIEIESITLERPVEQKFRMIVYTPQEGTDTKEKLERLLATQ